WQIDVENKILLRKTLQWGMNCWDTAYSYNGGNSEIGIGKFLKKNPRVRKNLFLITKASGARTASKMEDRLQTSLKRMNTNYIDLYHGLHQCQDPAWLTDEIRKWAENAKKRKLIRYFGITSHKNMEKVLMAVSKLDWIDAVMTSFNFHLMQKPEMQAAIDACYKAKIGLIAMKTLGMGQKTKTEADKKLLKHFLERGFTEAQAKVKLILEDKRFSSVCVGMKSVSVVNSNVAVAFNKTKLTQADLQAFGEYAQATCDGYCTGCADICDSSLTDMPYVSDIMRYLMYYNSYGEQDEARRLFAQIPKSVRDRLTGLDYSLVEARCPQHLPIRELMAEAVSKLA
ncbi:MAG: aldo/keto reductase, partial [Sedimentisphaerales bacterium]|nr:aldo/keto reductase [Sedimentisphaerales bacterium]